MEWRAGNGRIGRLGESGEVAEGMIYGDLGRTGVKISLLGLGGHEFLPDGRSRGFNEDFQRAVTPGKLIPGFGGEKRRSVIAAAHAAGINFFDATIDSEKEALARNLRELPPPREIYIQTRPEGMVYTNNPADVNNWRMANLDLLRAEALRIREMLGRDRVDFLNFGFLAGSLENDPDYLAKISRNIKVLKDEGLIRFACADTFSGEEIYLKQIGTGSFDAIFINFNIADDGGARRVLPEAARRGMGVFCREAFMKGALFKMGREAGIEDTDRLARAALKWIFSHREVTTVVVGMDSPAHIAGSLKVLDDRELGVEDSEILDRIRKTPSYAACHKDRWKNFTGEDI